MSEEDDGGWSRERNQETIISTMRPARNNARTCLLANDLHRILQSLLAFCTKTAHSSQMMDRGIQSM